MRHPGHPGHLFHLVIEVIKVIKSHLVIIPLFSTLGLAGLLHRQLCDFLRRKKHLTKYKYYYNADKKKLIIYHFDVCFVFLIIIKNAFRVHKT